MKREELVRKIYTGASNSARVRKKGVKLKEFLDDPPKEFDELCGKGCNYIFKLDF